MKQASLLLLSVLFFASCRSKKEPEDSESKFFPVVSFIQGQVKGIDTSLYRIIKVETEDTVSHSVHISREEFRKWAKPFLELPDISSSKWRDDYEETKMFDEAMGKAILTYTTKEADNEVQREDVMLNPTNASGNSDVETIIISTSAEENGAQVTRTMVWYVNKRFTIVTREQRGTAPERTRKLEVIWNDFTE